MKKDAKCKKCYHGIDVHKIMLYRTFAGEVTREKTPFPTGHLTAYGVCSCKEFVKRG